MTARGVGGGVTSVYPPSSSIGLPVGLAVGRGVGRGVEVGAFGDGSGGVDVAFVLVDEAGGSIDGELSWAVPADADATSPTRAWDAADDGDSVVLASPPTQPAAMAAMATNTVARRIRFMDPAPPSSERNPVPLAAQVALRAV